MFYFITETLQSEDDKKVEIVLRKYAIRKYTSLDFQSSVRVNITTDMLFLGVENTNSLKFTRLRSSLEFFLPVLIIKFDKIIGFTQYKIRYSLLSTALISFVVFGVVVSFANGQFEDCLGYIFVVILFCFLTWWELRVTKSYLQKAFQKIE